MELTICNILMDLARFKSIFTFVQIEVDIYIIVKIQSVFEFQL